MRKTAYFYIERQQLAKVLAYGCQHGQCATTMSCPFAATSHQDCELVTPRMWRRVLNALHITHEVSTPEEGAEKCQNHWLFDEPCPLPECPFGNRCSRITAADWVTFKQGEDH